MKQSDIKDIESYAKNQLKEAEEWHSKVNIREIVFGFNDGIVSTLALVAGVTGAFTGSIMVILAGLAAILAGAISMGAGAYISSKSEIEHVEAEMERETWEVENLPEVEREELRQIYKNKGPFSDEEIEMIVDKLTQDKDVWVDVMMVEELGIVRESFESPYYVGIIMAISFIVGGAIPFLPYIFVEPRTALLIAVIFTAISLFGVGAWKSTLSTRGWLISGLEMVLIGLLAGAVPYLLGELAASLAPL